MTTPKAIRISTSEIIRVCTVRYMNHPHSSPGVGTPEAIVKTGLLYSGFPAMKQPPGNFVCGYFVVPFQERIR